jgi:hypothetical protein
LTVAVDADSGHHDLPFRHVAAADLGRLGTRRLLIRHKRRDGPLAVARAIRPGHTRARSQRGWLADVADHPAMQLRRVDAQRHILAIAEVLAAHANWETFTTRPTWAVLMERTGQGRSTVAEHLAWLRRVGLLGLVAGGTTPEFSPGVLATPGAPERNEAAVYVLCAPRALRLVAVLNPDDVGAEWVHDGRDPEADPDTGEILDHQPEDDVDHHPGDGQTAIPPTRQPQSVEGTWTPSPSYGGIFPRTHASLGEASGAGLRPALNTSPPMCRQHKHDTPEAPPWPMDSTPAGRKERSAAAAALQARLPVLGRISTAHVAALTREWFLAGWTPASIVTALGRRPDGTPWQHSHDIRHVSGWVRHRLAAWRTNPPDPASPPGRSPADQLAAEAIYATARRRAQLEARAAAAATASTVNAPEVAAWADEVRAAIRRRRTT